MILLIVAIISLFMSFRATYEQKQTNEATLETANKLERYVKCQADWTGFLYKASQAGRDANADTQLTMDGLVDAIYQAKSAAETRVAIEAYRKARDAQKVALDQNPYPPPPSEVCTLG
jgi:hypothetical protein